MKEFNSRIAFALWLRGEKRFEYLAKDGVWKKFDNERSSASLFDCYDKWRIY